MITFNNLLESITIYLVCSLFAKKASSKVDELAWLSRFLLFVLVVILVLYGGVAIWSFVMYDKQLTCRSPVFIVSAVLNCFVSFLFCAIGYKITTNGRLAIEHQKAQLKTDYRVSEKLVSSSIKDISKAEVTFKQSLIKMWVIIISLTLVNSFSYLYTQILFFSENCGFYKNSNIKAYNFWSILDRMVVYCFWVIPIIVVFWPPDRTWYGF